MLLVFVDFTMEVNLFLKRFELAKKLNVSTTTVANWEKKGLPVIRKAGIVPLYNFEAVVDWLMDNDR